MSLVNVQKRNCHVGSTRRCLRAVAAILFVLTAGFFLLRATTETALESTLVLEETGEKLVPVLVHELSDGVMLACSGEETAVLVKIDGGSGKVLQKKILDFPLYWAGVRGEKLFIRDDSGESAALAEYSLATLEEISGSELGFTQNDLAFFDCDADGNVFYVLSRSRKILRSVSAFGEEKENGFDGKISFMQVNNSGKPLVYCDGKLYTENDSGFASAEFLSEPYRLLGDVLLDTDGTVYSVCDNNVKPIFICADKPYSVFSFCLNSENNLIMSKNGGGVIKYSTDGEPTDRCKLEKTALAICGTGGFYRDDSGIFYSAFTFETAEISPSPSPSPSGESNENYPPAYAEGNFIIMPADTTADTLRELFKPESVAVRDTNGNVIYHGRLATGMTANSWVIVIEGDCNGSGTVNLADIKAAMEIAVMDNHSGAKESAEDAYYRAADIDENGIVDLEDVALLFEMTE